jgi:hypothetical protein
MPSISTSTSSTSNAAALTWRRYPLNSPKRHISQRFFDIPPFRFYFYALADRIRRLLSGSAFQPPQESPPNTQLELVLIRSV